MLVLLGVLAAGVVAGLLRGGSIRRIGLARLRWTPVVLAGVALQGSAAFMGEGSLAFALALGSYVAVFAFAVANARRTGIALLAIGAFLNVVVVAVNGGMPVSRAALEKAGVAVPFTRVDHRDGLHVEMTDDSKLTFLADVIPLRRVGHVISPGDLVLWAGLMLMVQGLMRKARGRHVSGSSVTTSAPPGLA